MVTVAKATRVSQEAISVHLLDIDLDAPAAGKPDLPGRLVRDAEFQHPRLAVGDDIGGFLPNYLDQKILKDDPFQTIDQDGVGELIKLGTERGRATKPKLKVGICGEHGGDPASIHFCQKIGMDYVSCSPFRVPIARLAAAQAALEQGLA